MQAKQTRSVGVMLAASLGLGWRGRCQGLGVKDMGLFSRSTTCSSCELGCVISLLWVSDPPSKIDSLSSLCPPSHVTVMIK